MQNNVEETKSNIQEEKENVYIDDSLETLPMRSARRIIQFIGEKLANDSEITPSKRKAIESIITEERILKEIEQLVGKDYFNLSEEVTNLGRKININQKMDVDYSDRPEPIVLTNRVKMLYGGENDMKSKVISTTSRRFDKSKYSHSSKLKQQQELNKKLINNSKSLKVDPRDVEENEPIRLVYDEEKPSQKDIEIYRGDKNEELTDEERALQQAVNYMQKYKEYFKYIQDIKYLRHIPSKSARSMIIENFEKYLMDAKYYLHFYHKYSYFWAPESTRSVESYKGLFVPIEKRKEEETFDFKSLDSYEPLRTMIYQDFHDRVRNGLPPSLDLDGKLPLLAMHYARTTFVPPMTKEEMNRLFYPISETINHHIPEYKGPKAEPKQNLSILNRFQKYYFTRSHLRDLKTLFWYYDSYTECVKPVQVEEFLDNLSRLVYLFERDLFNTPKEDQCLGLFHSFTQHSVISKELLMIVSACLFMGLPFITSFEKIDNIQSFISDASQYCSIPVVSSADHRVVSNILGGGQLSVSKLLYYGNNESSFQQEKGTEYLNKDPVSNILKPIKKLSVNDKSSSMNYWEYIPSKIDTNMKIHNYKESIKSRTSELDSSDIENIRQSTISKYSRREKSNDILYMAQNGSDITCVKTSIFERVIDSLNEKLGDLIKEIKSNTNSSSKVNVLIISNGFSMLTTYLLAFCFENALSFSFVPTVAKEALLKTIGELQPNIIISDSHTLNCISEMLDSADFHKHSNPNTVINNDHLSNTNIEYEGLITDWTISNTLKNVRNTFSLLGQQKTNSHWDLKGMITIGSALPIETVHTLSRKAKFLYQVVQEDNILSPLLVRDLRAKEHSVQHEVLKPWKFFDINQEKKLVVGGVSSSVKKRPFVESQREEFMLATMENQVFDTNERSHTLEQASKLRNNLIEQYRQVEMPKDVRESLTKCLRLKEEFDFYLQVHKMVKKRESSSKKPTSLALFDNILYSVLLDELESITSIGNIDDLSEILKYLELRTELTAQSVQLQLIDFRFRFSSSLKEKKVKFSFKYDSRGLEVENLNGTIITNIFYVQNNYCFRTLVSDNTFYNLDLIEGIFGHLHKERAIIEKNNDQLYSIFFTKKPIRLSQIDLMVPSLVQSLRVNGLSGKDNNRWQMLFGTSNSSKLLEELKNIKTLACYGLDCFDGDNRLYNNYLISQFIEQNFKREKYSKL